MANACLYSALGPFKGSFLDDTQISSIWKGKHLS
jgi:hypothetical protein